MLFLIDQEFQRGIFPFQEEGRVNIFEIEFQWANCWSQLICHFQGRTAQSSFVLKNYEDYFIFTNYGKRGRDKREGEGKERQIPADPPDLQVGFKSPAVWKRHHYEETLLKLLSQKQPKRTRVEHTLSVLLRCHSKLNSLRLTSCYASLQKCFLACASPTLLLPAPQPNELVTLETREGKKISAVFVNSIAEIK